MGLVAVEVTIPADIAENRNTQAESLANQSPPYMFLNFEYVLKYKALVGILPISVGDTPLNSA